MDMHQDLTKPTHDRPDHKSIKLKNYPGYPHKRDHLLKWMVRKLTLLVFRSLPFDITLSIARRWPRKSKYLAGGKELICKDYLGNLCVHIDTSYPIERNMLTGTYDPPLQRLVSRLLKKGDVCLDIGANVGAVTLALAKIVAPTGHVFAFEPGPFLFRRLCNNFTLNPELEKITVCINQGVSDRPGKLFWAEDENNPGNASLLASGGIAVPVTTIDTFFTGTSLDRLNFIKIDVEGMEYEVIKGGVETIKKFQPVIYFESHQVFEDIRQMPLFTMIEELLKGLDYTFYTWRDDKMVHTPALTKLGTDTLAIPKDSSLAYIA